jgi:hypothetical protein
MLAFHKYLLLLVVLLSLYNGTIAQKSGVKRYRSVLRTVPDSVTSKMKNDREFLYANDPSYWVEKKVEKSATQKFFERLARSPILKWILYTFLAIVILFVLYQVMVVNNFFIFSKHGRKRKEELADGEELSGEELDHKLSEAIAAGQYRLAIRYFYLKTLQALSDKNFIVMHAKSTNRDYILQMKARNEGSDFKQLTNIYEYVWYGEYQPTAQQFNIIESNFKRFISQI